MSSISYDIDPGGDVEIVLKNPNTQQVVPDVILTQPRTSRSTSPRKASYKYDPDSVEFDSTCLFYDPSILSGLSAQESSEATEIRMRVSSKHLTFASPIFKTMLEGPWSEGAASTSSVREVSATGWNAEALAVVLNFIHNRHAQVPRHVSLLFLTYVATIVDYYHCQGAVQICAEMWRPTAHKYSVTWYNKRAVMWLYISWIFSWEDIFSSMVHMALAYGEGLGSAHPKDLPLAGILGKVDSTRQEFIGRILAGLDDLNEILSTETGCVEQNSSDCSTLALGSLMRLRRKIDSLDPPAISPFDEYTVDNFIDMIEELYVVA
ncbi:hypothetical protein FSARC_4720 [Fusarium sarcochroum]|uniref:BTB domain-containing protein n=1 Tax=Fusarium sarcochroum TaxID=1208366 RepID=A0A8H4XAC0_9HYPO|nr:hypothetical protein FSARC_4720 [Fusarium sarcochroum]